MVHHAARGLACAAVLLLGALPTDAQTYGPATPPPRTSDRAALVALAHKREIHERFARGLAAEAKGDWTRAAAEFARIVALDPAEPQGSTARYDQAIAEARLGKYDVAEPLLREALRRDPGFAAAAANLVSVASAAGDLPAARAAADLFVKIAPDAARAHIARGIVALRAGDIATARADFRVLLDANPSYAAAHYDLGIVELEAKRYDAARTELEAACALAPDFARARFALGIALLREGRKDDARAAFARAAHDAVDPTLRDLARTVGEKL